MATPFLDTFTEAATTNLEDHTPTGGTAWTLTGTAAAAIINATTDALRSRTTSASIYVCDDQGSSNQYVQARLKNLLSSIANSYVCCRLVDSSNFVGWRAAGTGSTGLRLSESVAGTVTDLHTFQGVDEVVYRVEVDGTTARIYADGVQNGTDKTVASSTETSQGLRIGSDQASDWIDEFEAGALGSGSPYSLAAATGSFTLTGNAAVLSVSRKLAAATGTFTFTGNAATLVVGRSLAAATGAFTLTGNAATLTYTAAGAYTLAANVGSFALTGNPVEFTYTRSSAWSVVGAASGSWSDASDGSSTWTSATGASGSWSDAADDSASWTVVPASSGIWN